MQKMDFGKYNSTEKAVCWQHFGHRLEDIECDISIQLRKCAEGENIISQKD